MSKNNYINLLTRGRLYPTWVEANYRQFKQEEYKIGEKDPCNEPTKSGKKELKKHQLFVSKYLDINSPYKNMLLYHGLGSGKTLNALALIDTYQKATGFGFNVFILLKASLKLSVWDKEYGDIWDEQNKKHMLDTMKFISYDAPNADKLFMDAVRQSDTSKKNLFIIEEAHNFIKNVYSNVVGGGGKRAVTIYEYLIQDQKENDGTRILLLSGTPAINEPFELAILFNLLRPDIFPKNEILFNQEFITMTQNYKQLNPARKNMFQRRIMGLVSYYHGATPDYYASKRNNFIYVTMSKYQEEVYEHFEKIELEYSEKARKRGKKGSDNTYKSYTRQACNFVFPFMNQKMMGENRPRPRFFKVSEKEVNKLEKGKIKLEEEKGKESYYNIQNYLEETKKFVITFDNYLESKNEEDKKNGYTIENDIKEFKEKYEYEYEKFLGDKKKSELFKAMYKSSAKFLCCIFNTFKSEGPILIYTNYVMMEGIEILKIYLKYFGYTNMKEDMEFKEENKKSRYTEYHGGIEKIVRSKNMDLFNDKRNINGEYCKIFFISGAGAEGLTLMNIRQVHIIEPHWNEVRIIQMIGRAVRFCSHKNLPKNKRVVDIYRYKVVREDNKKATTDEVIEEIARSKEGLIQSFLDAIKEVSIDCELNKPHNSLVQDIKCFKFDEPSLFDEQIGPAYKEDMIDDIKISNGTNNLKSKTVRIKVIKIKAVKQLTNENEQEIKYSRIENYWFNPETLVVYDDEMVYPIGKVGEDKEGLPKKLDKDTYIIDKVIMMPLIK